MELIEIKERDSLEDVRAINPKQIHYVKLICNGFESQVEAAFNAVVVCLFRGHLEDARKIYEQVKKAMENVTC